MTGIQNPLRALRTAVLGLSLCSLSVGCQFQGQSPQPSQDSVAANPGQRITLKVSGWGASPVEKQLLQEVLNNFEQEHPQIRVKFEVIADQYMDVLKTRLIGDAAPDVFYLDAVEAPFLMQAQVLEPLNGYIDPSFDLEDFERTTLEPFQIGKTIYGLPKDYSTLALFYNKKRFQDAGLKGPPQTWAQLVDYSKQLTPERQDNQKPKQYGLGLSPELARLVYIIQAHGGQVMEQGRATFAQPPALKGLQQIVDQYRGQTAVLPSDVGSSSASDLLGQNKVAMVIEGNWAIPDLQKKFPNLALGTAEVPKMNQRSGTMLFTVAYVMNQRAKHKKEAWQLISYLTGKKGMKKWTGSGFALPTRKSVAQQLRYDQDPLRSPLVRGAAYATPWQLGEYPTPIQTSFNNQFLSALLGEQPLATALKRAQQTANDQISKNKASGI